MFFAEGDDQIKVGGFQLLGAGFRRQKFLQLGAHPQQIDARPCIFSPRLRGDLKLGGQPFGQPRIDFDARPLQEIAGPERRLAPGKRQHFDDFSFLLEQLDEPPPAVWLHGHKYDGRKGGRSLQVSSKGFVVLIVRRLEILGVGEDENAAPSQHRHLVGGLEFRLQSAGLEFDLRQAPLAEVGWYRGQQSRAALFVQKPVRSPKKVGRLEFSLTEPGDEFCWTHIV